MSYIVFKNEKSMEDFSSKILKNEIQKIILSLDEEKNDEEFQESSKFQSFFDNVTAFCDEENFNFYKSYQKEIDQQSGKNIEVIKKINKWSCIQQVNVFQYGIIDTVVTIEFLFSYKYKDEEKNQIVKLEKTCTCTHIFEFKNVTIKAKDFNQILRYKDAVSLMIHPRSIYLYLIGTDLDKEDCAFLSNSEIVSVNEFVLDIDGFSIQKYGDFCFNDSIGKLDENYWQKIVSKSGENYEFVPKTNRKIEKNG